MPDSEQAPRQIEVPVASGGSIRIEATPGGLLLSSGTRWRQPLTREEAWRLAEAIDELATKQASE